MNVGIHPALNRFVAGLDMVASGVRVMLNAAGPADIEALQARTAAAFEEKAKFEEAVAMVIAGTGTEAEHAAAIETIKARLPVKKV